MNRHLSIALALLCTSAFPLRAAIIWNGSPTGADDTPGRVFGNASTECPPPGSITPVRDDSEYAYVWRYSKPTAPTSYRCESRNIRVNGYAYKGFTKGKTFYIGWGSKLKKVDGGQYGDWVIFQWKSYGNGSTQNYPLLMTAVAGKVKLIYVNTSGAWQTIWEAKTDDNSWRDYVLGIHLSDNATTGWVELYVDGVQQEIGGRLRFPARTLDVSNEPKWGAYNRDQPGHEMEQLIANPRVATTLQDLVKP